MFISKKLILKIINKYLINKNNFIQIQHYKLQYL